MSTLIKGKGSHTFPNEITRGGLHGSPTGA
jgi:hypothetical protein